MLFFMKSFVVLGERRISIIVLCFLVMNFFFVILVKWYSKFGFLLYILIIDFMWLLICL